MTIKYQSDRFVLGKAAKVETVGEGVRRQVLGFNDALLLARAEFDEGAVGYAHDHPHSQLTYVESGVFEFMVGDEKKRLQAGDCAYIPPGLEHGARCLEAGVLLDIFNPVRDDFLADEQKP